MQSADASPSRQHAEREVLTSVDGVVGRSLSIPEPRPVGRSLRGIGLVSGSPRWQNLARHFPAGRALVSDKTRLNSERRDPHNLVHRGAAAGAGNSTSSSRKVRHNTPSTLVLSPFHKFPGPVLVTIRYPCAKQPWEPIADPRIVLVFRTTTSLVNSAWSPSSFSDRSPGRASKMLGAFAFSAPTTECPAVTQRSPLVRSGGFWLPA